MILSHRIPVSYTHLDVYKRQVIAIVCGSAHRQQSGQVEVSGKIFTFLPGKNFTQALDTFFVDVYKRQPLAGLNAAYISKFLKSFLILVYDLFPTVMTIYLSHIGTLMIYD